MTKPNPVWSPEACEELTRLVGCSEGYTAGVIADKLNASGLLRKLVTRNSVVAKCGYLGLKLPLSKKKFVSNTRQKMRVAPPKKRVQPKLPPDLPEIIPLREVAGLDPSHHCTIMGLNRTTCHWPMWGYNDHSVDKLYCGAPIPDGKIYCEAHAAIAFDRTWSKRSGRSVAWWLRPR